MEEEKINLDEIDRLRIENISLRLAFLRQQVATTEFELMRQVESVAKKVGVEEPWKFDAQGMFFLKTKTEE